MSLPPVLSRSRGCLIGLLAGDALGSQVEFMSKGAIANAYPGSGGPTSIHPSRVWNTSAGQATDDGEMALALANSIIAADDRTLGYSQKRAGDAYVAWGRSAPFDMGGTTRQGLQAIEAGRPAVSQSQANGALMRAAPIGIRYFGRPQDAAMYARIDARLTHPSSVTVAANAAFCAAIATLVAGKPASKAYKAADREIGSEKDEIERKEVRRWLMAAAIRSFPTVYDDQMQGWVAIAFQNAFAHLAAGTPFEEALISTVARGGDTDTNAAICGALLGAAQGVEAIPAQWRDAVLGCSPASGTPRPRPAVYWPSSAISVADKLVEGW